MLLPSALSCDSAHILSTPRRQLFASPPLSPPSSSSSSTHPAITNLYSTCRALQSMLSPPPQLPSPPMTYAETPSRLRLRARSTKPDDTQTPRRKITKRAAPPPRGLNKRRRALDDDLTHANAEEDSSSDEKDNNNDNGPSTPKRARLAPEVLPLGLERSDFHNLVLHEATYPSSVIIPSIEQPSENLSEEWSTEDDRILVELVLEKLKLTRSDWQDCARSLGKDRGSVGRRWKSLMVKGEVGLRSSARNTGASGSRRGKIHGTWR